MAVIVIALNRGFLVGSVHPFDLAIGPWMLHLGEPVFDAIFPAGATEYVLKGVAILWAVGELDTIVSKDRVEDIGAALMRLPRNWAAIIFPAFLCSST